MISVLEQSIQKSANLPREDTYLDQDGFLRCNKCKGLRQQDIKFGPITRRVYGLCACLTAERDRQEREKKAQQLHDTIARNRSIGLTDPLMGEHTFDRDEGYNPQAMEIARNYVRNWEDMKQNSCGLLFWGSVGTGKSFIADCIGNALLDKGVRVLITNFSRLINQLSDYDLRDKNGFIDSLNSYELLIIDDLGMERSTEYVREQCFNIIDSRYRSGLPMILTTNLTPKYMRNVAETDQSRIFDRILERTIPVIVNDQNIRQIHSQQNRQSTLSLLRLRNDAPPLS